MKATASTKVDQVGSLALSSPCSHAASISVLHLLIRPLCSSLILSKVGYYMPSLRPSSIQSFIVLTESIASARSTRKGYYYYLKFTSINHRYDNRDGNEDFGFDPCCLTMYI